MPKHRLPFGALAVPLALAVVACSSAGASPTPPGSPGGPSTAPTGSPATGELDHPTGATDVVLRLEEGGGFVPIEFNAYNAPIFTLYGDGRIIFQQTAAAFPEPGPDGVTRMTPWRIAQLDEGQVQDLISFALGQGGLGAAAENYGNDMVADAAHSYFTIDAGGVRKSVDVYALGMETPGSPDELPRKALGVLAERLRDFDRGGSIATDVYVPSAWRAVLIEREGDPTARPVAWPWPDLKVSDFASDINAAGGLQMPHRAMSAEEIGALGLGDIPGGAQGLAIAGPDGKTYTLVIRPLLPDETA